MLGEETPPSQITCLFQNLCVPPEKSFRWKNSQRNFAAERTPCTCTSGGGDVPGRVRLSARGPRRGGHGWGGM